MHIIQACVLVWFGTSPYLPLHFYPSWWASTSALWCYVFSHIRYCSVVKVMTRFIPMVFSSFHSNEVNFEAQVLGEPAATSEELVKYSFMG